MSSRFRAQWFSRSSYFCSWLLLLSGGSALAAEPEPEVVIEGERPQPQAPPRSAHVSGSVILAERLEQAGVTAADALREVPGVQIVQLGGFGAPATLSLRGASADQTPVYLGGVRINDDVGGTADLAEIPLFMVERVEVYRSHAPLVADQFGIGGAILFEPRKPRDEARLRAMAGSAGARSGGLSAGHASEERGVLAGVERSAADNGYSFQSGNGTAFVNSDDGTLRLSNADVASQNLWLLAQQKLGEAKLRLLYHHADRELGAPKLALTASRLARIRLNRDLFAISSAVPVEPWNGSLELVTSGVVSETQVDDPLSELGYAAKKTATPAERIEQSVLARQDLNRFRLAEQFLVSEERLRRIETANTEPVEVLSARRLAARAALGVELEIAGPLQIEGTVAWSCFGTATSGSVGCPEHAANGRVGFDLRHAGYEFYGSVGRYQNPPTLAKLYGASLLLRGNPALQAELGTAAEAGARYQLFDRARNRRLWFDVASFARFSTDLVTYARTPQGYLIPINSQRSRTLGAEFSLGATPFRFLNAEGSLSLLDPRDTTPGRATRNDILSFSRLVASGLLSVRAEPGREWMQAFSAGLRVWHQSSRYVDPAGLGVIPEQTSFDLEASAECLARALRAQLRLTNLFASRRFDSVGFVLPNRSLFVSLEAAL
ncbi:MAG TPA: TonB-dependent receptor [Polyangiaceae bacterium]|nr:TonB-dependent receptor [Polyangiaceae bacterium]